MIDLGPFSRLTDLRLQRPFWVCHRPVQVQRGPMEWSFPEHTLDDLYDFSQGSYGYMSRLYGINKRVFRLHIAKVLYRWLHPESMDGRIYTAHPHLISGGFLVDQSDINIPWRGIYVSPTSSAIPNHLRSTSAAYAFWGTQNVRDLIVRGERKREEQNGQRRYLQLGREGRAPVLVGSQIVTHDFIPQLQPMDFWAYYWWGLDFFFWLSGQHYPGARDLSGVNFNGIIHHPFCPFKDRDSGDLRVHFHDLRHAFTLMMSGSDSAVVYRYDSQHGVPGVADGEWVDVYYSRRNAVSRDIARGIDQAIAARDWYRALEYYVRLKHGDPVWSTPIDGNVEWDAPIVPPSAQYGLSDDGLPAQEPLAAHFPYIHCETRTLVANGGLSAYRFNIPGDRFLVLSLERGSYRLRRSQRIFGPSMPIFEAVKAQLDTLGQKYSLQTESGRVVWETRPVPQLHTSVHFEDGRIEFWGFLSSPTVPEHFDTYYPDPSHRSS